MLSQALVILLHNLHHLTMTAGQRCLDFQHPESGGPQGCWLSAASRRNLSTSNKEHLVEIQQQHEHCYAS